LSGTVDGVDKAGAAGSGAEYSRSIGSGDSRSITVSGRSGATGGATAGSGSRNGSTGESRWERKLQLSGSLEVDLGRDQLSGSLEVDLGRDLMKNVRGRL
jgi:hypothetical protein